MKKQFFVLFLVASTVALSIVFLGAIYLEKRAATQVGIGVLLSWLNLLFYSLVSALLLAKKNVALVVPLIVIKYLLLVSVVYYIWASADVTLVLVGVFSELILTALLLIPTRRLLMS